MRRSFFGMPSAALVPVFACVFLVCGSLHARAQQAAGNFDDEFSAFKKKVAAAKTPGDAEGVSAPASAPPAAAPAPPAPVPASVMPVLVPDGAKPAPKAAAVPSTNQLVNPLGPAATLPVKGQLPATANALSLGTPEDVQAQMDAQADAQEKKMNEKAFDMALKQLMPLTTDQIRTLYDRFEENRKAAETPIRIPETKTIVQTISLDPGAQPPVIHTTPGYVTTVSILDSTGAPWPVQDMSYAGKFDITPPEAGGHVFRITPSSAHGVGNISMRLVDMITPVIFTLTTGLDEVDYRADFRLPKPGPLAKTPLIEFGGISTVAGTDPNLVSVLDGTLPAGAEKLHVKGVDGRTTAWRVDGKMYLRTPLSLLSPGWDSSVASADGTTVYTLNDTPVLLLSDAGKMVRARILAAADEVTNDR